MRPTSWLEINLSRLAENVSLVRQMIGTSVRLCGVVKANAYGLGATRVAQRLASLGVDMLAVYSADQAEELVCSGVRVPILLLEPQREMARTSDLYRPAVAGHLHFTIHDPQQLDQVDRIGRQLGCRIPVHLYMDTGMSRSGLNAAQMATVLDRLAALTRTRLAGVYTHLATAESDAELAEAQMDLFEQFLDAHQARIGVGIVTHAANTFAMLRGGRYHHDMVRVGLGLLGYGVEMLKAGPILPASGKLRPLVRWLSRINHIQRYTKGSAVGYGSTRRLSTDSLLAVVPVGYGDGYPLALGNRAVVRVWDHDEQTAVTAPVVGRVSMDQIVIDLTDSVGAPITPTATTGWGIGNIVELVSDAPDSPCALPRLARLADSSPYEMLCRLSPNLPRRYLTPTAAYPAGSAGNQMARLRPER